MAAARLQSLATAPVRAAAPRPRPDSPQLAGSAGEVWGKLDISQEDQEAALPVVRSLGYTAQQIGNFHNDVLTLGPAEVLASVPPTAGVPAKAALRRILDVVVQSGQSSRVGHSQGETQPALEQLLVSAGLRQSDPQQAEHERVRQRTSLAQLIREAGVGDFAAAVLPEQDQLRRATTAALTGQFPSFEDCQVPASSDRALAMGLQRLLKSGVAALLAWQVSPAALLSELGLALEVALEPSLTTTDAATMAVKYTERVRQLLHDASLSEAHSVEDDPAAYKAALGVFLRRDPALFAETRDSLGIQTVRPKQQGGSGASIGTAFAPAAQQGVCLRFATSETPECANSGKACAYSHVCPFCIGDKCNNRPGYLHYHVCRLRTPLQLVAKKAAQQLERQPRADRQRRSRSRSRSAVRRRPQRAGPQAEPRWRAKEEEVR